ncbi:MAG: hypothetical protein ACE5GC_07335 [Acidimicrobiia bacterium]
MEHLESALAEIDRASPWVLAAEVAAATTDLVAYLRDQGAEDLFIVSATEGAGDLPENVPVFYTRTSGPTIMSGLRAYLDTIADPSPELLAVIDDFDPDRRARVIVPPFHTAPTAAGRPVYGGRLQEWAALEDKTVVGPIWDEAGIAAAQSAVVPVSEAPEVARSLAGPLGTVWAADNHQGWHGGADYTRRVPDEAAALAAVAWFSSRARRVRVMPFLEGLPCSIHGFVTATDAAAFRPVEMVVFPHVSGFMYAGTSTFWDPPEAFREEMRAIALAVAKALRDLVGYRGPFSVDGVATKRGFLPTELNPRLSAGLAIQAAGADLALGSITRGYLAGDLDVDAAWLEEQVVTGADANRVGGLSLSRPLRLDPERFHIAVSDGSVAEVTEDDADATVDVGSAPQGSFIRVRFDQTKIAPGPSILPSAAAVARFADERWGLDLPDFEMPSDPFS